MKNTHLTIVGSLALISAIASFVFFQFYYKYHLAHRLDIQLFLYSQDYLLGYFKQPAWLSALVGDFLTQFFYFNGGGALTLTVLLLLLGGLFFLAMGKITNILSKDSAKKQRVYFWLQLLLSLCLIKWEGLRNCGLEYKLSSTISLIGGISLFFLYFHFPKRFRWLSGALLLLLSYWLFGYGIWPLLLLVFAFELCLHKYFVALFFVCCSVCIPLLLRPFYFLTVKQAFRYPAVSFWEMPDYEVEKLLKLDVLSSSGQWNSVALLSEKYQLKFGLGAYYYNLSHGMRGDLPVKLMTQAQPGARGLLLQLNPNMSPLAIWSSNEAWFQLGDMTMAEHSTLLGLIFSPEHRSVRMIKRLAEINMITGDTAAVQKYLRILQKTWLYKSWADQRVLGKETAAVVKWLQKKQELTAQTDTLRDAVNPALSLRLLLNSNRNNKLALDYLLCYDLLSKNITDFMQDYDKYKLPNKETPDRLYAEGLLIGLTLRHASEEQVKQYLIYPDWFTEFSNYTKLYEKDYLGRDYLIKQFGKTYWFYYHFAKFK